jgi:predicted HNH restriction endonuclease
MSTYLLTWNPKITPFDALPTYVRGLAAGKSVDFGWSCGNTRTIDKEARVFLLRQGPDNPGVVGSGRVTEGSYEDEHWDPAKQKQGLKAWYVGVKWDSLMLPEECLSRSELLKGILPESLVNSFAAGVIFQPKDAANLEKRWAAHCRSSHFSASIHASPISAWEGNRVEYRAYRRKRDHRLMQAARRAAKGICAVCEVDYSKILKGKGVRVLQVHHKHQLGQLDTPRLNSSDDLVVVCANCHALIHMDSKKALPVKALKSMLRKPA